MIDWMGIKHLAAELSLERDALHIYGAFVIQIVAAGLSRRPLSSWVPWFVVFTAELLNELLDIWFGDEAIIQPWQLAGARHDILNTMVLPTALLLLCRHADFLFTNAKPRLEPGEGSGD